MDEPTPNHPESNSAGVGVYAHAASIYWAAGWHGVLPLPPGQKKSPPTGYTGADGRYPSWPDIHAWADNGHGHGNIALRMPDDVIGIDVDAYEHKQGATSLAALEATHGTLPPTWSSSARGDGVSGIRFYRVPTGLNWREKFAGPDIELIKRVHRYAVVWPSTNPKAGGAQYVWTRPDGTRGDTEVPPVDALPWLPAAWVAALRDDTNVAPVEAGKASASDPFGGPSRPWSKAEASAQILPKLDAFRAMRTPEDSGFNQALNALAMFVGHFVPEFWGREQVAEWLYDAAVANRSVEFQGASDVRATIASGLGAGMRQPFSCREPETEESPGADAPLPAAEPDAVDALLARMLDRDALMSLPAPVALIEDMYDLNSESWLIGGPGSFKSFVALDQAIHVALGRPWRTKRVHQGEAVYIVAEGSKSIPLRVKAWEAVYGAEIKGVRFLPEPVQVANPLAWSTLVEACRRIKPVMVILDTQARITVGLEENSNTDMGRLVEAVRRLKEATGACVLVVHHTGRDGLNARGASALDGAQDTEVRIDRPEDKTERLAMTATIGLDKQKDGSEDIGFPIRMRKVQLGIDPVTGRVLSSLALEPIPSDPFATATGIARPAADWIERSTDNQGDVLRAMKAVPDDTGATQAEVAAWVKDHRALDSRPGMKRTSLRSALIGLRERGLVTQIGQRYYLTELVVVED